MRDQMEQKIADSKIHRRTPFFNRWGTGEKQMAEWTDGRRFLHVGLLGLQYHSRLTCRSDKESVARTVTDFYSRRRAHGVPTGTAGTLEFRRGSVWLGRLAGLLPLSETWPYQTIVVILKAEAGATLVDVSYDVRMFFSLICAPNQIEKEAKQLKALLEAG